MAEDFKKLKRVVEKAQNITLFPSPDFRKDSFPAILALFYSLEKLGKNVNLISEDYPQNFKFLIKKGVRFWDEADFLISIKEAGAKVSQLSYQKTASGLALYLKTNGQDLKKENVDFQRLGLGDVLITLGIGDLKKAENFLKEEPKFLINIDNQLSNRNYGNINLIEVSSSLSEIVFDVISSIDEKLFGQAVLDCLLTGLIQGTSNFQDPKLGSQTFQKVSYLIEKGADFKKITSQLYNLEQEGSLRLFGKVLSKLEISEEKNLASVTLGREDFSEAGASPRNLKFTLSKLTSALFPFQNFLCLWQSSNSASLVRGVFYSPNKKLVEKISAKFSGEQKGDGVLFNLEESNPQKVKDEILEIL